MNTPGTHHISAKEVKAIDSCHISTAYRKIQEVFNNLPERRKTRTSKVTIKEYCEHYGLELPDFVNIFNTTLKRNIQIV